MVVVHSRMCIDQHNPDPRPRNPQSPHTQSQKSQIPSMSTKPPTLREVVVGTRTGMSMMVPLKLDNADVQAVVDSGAQATVMSDEFYKSLKNPPKITEKVILKTASKGDGFEGHYVPKATLTFGKLSFTCSMYVGPVTDPFILGLDFLLPVEGVIDLGRYTVTVKDKHGNTSVTPAELVHNSGESMKVCRLTLEKRTVVPPMSKIGIAAHVEDLPSEWEGKDVVTQPLSPLNKNCLMPFALAKGNEMVPITLTNPTDNFVTFKKGSLIGSVVEAVTVYSDDGDDIIPYLDDDILVRKIKSPKPPTTKSKSPDVSPKFRTDPLSNSQSKASQDDPNNRSFPNVTTTDDAPLPDKIPFKERLTKSPDLKKTFDKMPEHLHGLFEKSIVNLYDDQAIAIGETLIEFEDVFAKDDFDIGCFNGGIVHDIDTGDAAPIKARMRRTPLGFQGEEQKHLEKLLKTKVIRPSISDWASAPVLIRKRDRTVRYCIDYRPLNGKTVKSVATLPLISEAIDCLADNVWCSTLDWNSGYYQLLLNPKDCHKTAFITKFGLFEFLCMPFGLCNAPSTFQRVVQFIFAGMLWKEVLAYLDDIFILGKSFKGHLTNIRKALLRLRKYNLKLKPRKCVLFQTEVPFLGRLVG